MLFWTKNTEAAEALAKDLWTLPLTFLIPFMILIFNYYLKPRFNPITNILINTFCYLWSGWQTIELLEHLAILSPIRPSGFLGQVDTYKPIKFGNKVCNARLL